MASSSIYGTGILDTVEELHAALARPTTSSIYRKHHPWFPDWSVAIGSRFAIMELMTHFIRSVQNDADGVWRLCVGLCTDQCILKLELARFVLPLGALSPKNRIGLSHSITHTSQSHAEECIAVWEVMDQIAPSSFPACVPQELTLA